MNRMEEVTKNLENEAQRVNIRIEGYLKDLQTMMDNIKKEPTKAQEQGKYIAGCGAQLAEAGTQLSKIIEQKEILEYIDKKRLI